jgi:hypothetical protein
MQALLDDPTELEITQSEPVAPRMLILFKEPKRDERRKKIESRGLVERRRATDLAQANALLTAGSDDVDDRAGARQCLNSRRFW